MTHEATTEPKAPPVQIMADASADPPELEESPDDPSLWGRKDSLFFILELSALKDSIEHLGDLGDSIDCVCRPFLEGDDDDEPDMTCRDVWAITNLAGIVERNTRAMVKQINGVRARWKSPDTKPPEPAADPPAEPESTNPAPIPVSIRGSLCTIREMAERLIPLAKSIDAMCVPYQGGNKLTHESYDIDRDAFAIASQASVLMRDLGVIRDEAQKSL